MNELKARVRKVIEVRHDDLEEFVELTYGREWSFVAAEEAINHSEYAFRVTGEASDYSRRNLDNWLDYAGPYVGALDVLNDLAQRRLIETGEYLVKVTW